MNHTFACFDVPEDVDLDAVFAVLGTGTAMLQHRFTPHGESCSRAGQGRVVVVHTWPEHGVATVDVYGDAVDLAVLRELGWAVR